MGIHLYYSTQTALAHHIAEQYYGKFYVYCSVEFNPRTNPGSSSPYLLYKHFRQVVEKYDKSDPKIEQHKEKLMEVANYKLLRGDIDKSQYDAIQYEVATSETRDFVPFLYFILKDRVQGRTILVPIQKRANPNSEEYIVEDLQSDEFEVIKTTLELSGGI